MPRLGSSRGSSQAVKQSGNQEADPPPVIHTPMQTHPWTVLPALARQQLAHLVSFIKQSLALAIVKRPWAK